LRIAGGGKLRQVLDSIGDAADFFGVELKDVNQRGVYGNTPLKIATVRGDIDAACCWMRGQKSMQWSKRVVQSFGMHLRSTIPRSCAFSWTRCLFGDRNSLLDQTPLEAAQRRGLREVVKVLEETVSTPEQVIRGKQ
jgi:hypothetical protein